MLNERDRFIYLQEYVETLNVKHRLYWKCCNFANCYPLYVGNGYVTIGEYNKHWGGRILNSSISKPISARIIDIEDEAIAFLLARRSIPKYIKQDLARIYSAENPDGTMFSNYLLGVHLYKRDRAGIFS